tara:strand:+ start:530 stop:1309 length:780 start_codon:yes stop_codon:yes gene_type:complete
VAASWYSLQWSTRIPVYVDTSASTGNVDAQLVIPTTMQAFWQNVESDGHDVRFTKADGITEIPYQRASFNAATQAATFDIEQFAVPVTNELSLVWLYTGNASASDGSTSHTPSAAVSAYITPEAPSNNTVLTAERLGATTARVAFSKSSSDIAFVYVPLTLELSRRCGGEYNANDGYEGLQNFLYTVEASGSPVGAAIDVTLVRLTDCGTNGRELWARLAIQAGADTTNYITHVDMESTLGRRLRRSFEFQVRDIVESS